MQRRGVCCDPAALHVLQQTSSNRAKLVPKCIVVDCYYSHPRKADGLLHACGLDETHNEV